MRIASVRDGVVPIASAIANAYIDFSKMTASVVAVTVEDGQGRSATGYGFNSNGRYAQPGLLPDKTLHLGILAEPGFRHRQGRCFRHRLLRLRHRRNRLLAAACSQHKQNG